MTERKYSAVDAKILRDVVQKLERYTFAKTTIWFEGPPYVEKLDTGSISELLGSLRVVQDKGIGKKEDFDKIYRALEELQKISGWRRDKERERKADEVRIYLHPIISDIKEVILPIEEADKINELQNQLDEANRELEELRSKDEVYKGLINDLQETIRLFAEKTMLTPESVAEPVPLKPVAIQLPREVGYLEEHLNDLSSYILKDASVEEYLTSLEILRDDLKDTFERHLPFLSQLIKIAPSYNNKREEFKGLVTLFANAVERDLTVYKEGMKKRGVLRQEL